MAVARRHLRSKPHHVLGHYGTLGASEKEKEIKRTLLAHGRLPTFDRAKIAPHDEDTYALPPVVEIPDDAETPVEEQNQEQGEEEGESGKSSGQGGRRSGTAGGGPVVKNSRSDPMPENMRVSMGRMEGKTQVTAVATAMAAAKTSVTAPAAPAPAKGVAQGIKAAVAAVILVFNGHAVDLDGFMGHSLQPENRITPGDSVRSIVGTGIASPKENPRFWKALGD